MTCSTLAADSVCLLNEVWILLGGWHLVRIVNLSTASLVVVVVATSQNFISEKTVNASLQSVCIHRLTLGLCLMQLIVRMCYVVPCNFFHTDFTHYLYIYYSTLFY